MKLRLQRGPTTAGSPWRWSGAGVWGAMSLAPLGLEKLQTEFHCLWGQGSIAGCGGEEHAPLSRLSSCPTGTFQRPLLAKPSTTK